MANKTEADRIVRLENLMFEQGEIINRMREQMDDMALILYANENPERATQ